MCVFLLDVFVAPPQETGEEPNYKRNFIPPELYILEVDAECFLGHVASENAGVSHPTPAKLARSLPHCCVMQDNKHGIGD